MADKGEQFAAIPVRAIGDTRLTASHFRLLGAIARHDRFSRNGIGCYASHKTLSTEAAVHYTNVSKIVDDLATWRYIRAGRHPLNRRLRVYSLNYNDNPATVGEHANNGAARHG